MKPVLPKGLSALSELFSAHGYALHLVGGFVRNMVLGSPGGDFDVCSAALPDAAANIAREAGLNVIEKAPELGTIEIHLPDGDKRVVLEHTTFRRDYYPQGGVHRPYRVDFTQSIEEDASRRDFTIGTLYLNISTGVIADPTGKALDDIRSGVLRTANQNPDETIRDDGLRIMRMARFAAELGFSIDSDLFASAQHHAKLLADISAERKRDELIKILLSDIKYPQINRGPLYGLELLRDTGALAFVLPNLHLAKGIKQSTHFHKYDVLSHCFHTCAAAPPVLTLRLAALLHDIGKPAALDQSGKMYGHENIGEQLALKELMLLRFDKKTINAVLPLIKNHMFDLDAKAKPNTVRRRAIKLGREAFTNLIALRRADVVGSGNPVNRVFTADKWQAELDRMTEQNVPFSVKELNITGDEVAQILGTGPSVAVGKMLELLHQECIITPHINTNAALKNRVKALAQKSSNS